MILYQFGCKNAQIAYKGFLLSEKELILVGNFKSEMVLPNNWCYYNSMKKLVMFLLAMLAVGCVPEVATTAENINKIFSSQDFTFEFHEFDQTKKSISFRNDYLVYKSDQPTIRREITYDEVLLINDFIQKIVAVHQEGAVAESSSYYVIKNTASKVVIIPKQEDFYFEALLRTLKLVK